MKSVRRYITRHRLSGRVTLHGPVPQQTVLTAMQEHHLFASTSYDFDNQPMVLLEAHAAGTPVLLCDPDLTEVVPPEGTVLTATPDSQSIRGRGAGAHGASRPGAGNERLPAEILR